LEPDGGQCGRSCSVEHEPPTSRGHCTRAPPRNRHALRSFVRRTKSNDTPTTESGLEGRRILIVEDEFLIAEDLADYFLRLGAKVIGPATSLAEGFRLADEAEAAVLDINLRGEHVFPLAEALLARNVPFVFFTAYESIGLPPHLRVVGRFLKPASYSQVKRALARRLAEPDGDDDELVRLLPKLRIAARLLVQDGHAADRLVERALEQAVATLDCRDATVPLEDWLVSIMRDTSSRSGRGSMN
jgi:CheY-like chemotaxis protein